MIVLQTCDNSVHKAPRRGGHHPGHGTESEVSMQAQLSRGDTAIAAVIKDGHYRVDLIAGTVVGRFGRELRCPPDRDGYKCFTAVTSAGRMNIRVHRLVAAVAWGLDAIVGRQVAHRDGNQKNNAIDNLWLPASVKEHNEHDGTVANLTYRTPLKTSWPPCADCGEPNGAHRGNRIPARHDGARFGIAGTLCNACYQRHCRASDPERHRAYQRAWHGRNRASVNAKKRLARRQERS